MMGRIYSDATVTMIWLGREDPRTVQSALAYLCRLVRLNTEILLKDVKEQQRPTTEHMFKTIWYFWKGQPVYAAPEHPSADIELQTLGDAASKKLFRNYYFRRGWVIQEVAMGREAEISWGDARIPLEFFALFNKVICTLESTKLIDDQGAWTGANNFAAMIHMRFSARNYPLIKRLQMSRKNDFTNPLDRVYGMIAMASPSKNSSELEGDLILETKYGIPVLQCYRELATQYLTKDRWWDVLVSVQHFGSIAPDWPSWIPDWGICANRIEIQQTLLMPDFIFPDEEMTVPIEVRQDGECILPQGYRLTTVKVTIGEDMWTASIEELRWLLQWLLQHHSISEVVWAATAGHSSRGNMYSPGLYDLTWLHDHKEKDRPLHFLNTVALLASDRPRDQVLERLASHSQGTGGRPNSMRSCLQSTLRRSSERSFRVVASSKQLMGGLGSRLTWPNLGIWLWLSVVALILSSSETQHSKGKSHQIFGAQHGNWSENAMLRPEPSKNRFKRS